jgi:hypothetical protein
MIKLLSVKGPMSSRDIIKTFEHGRQPMSLQQKQALRTILVQKDHFVKVSNSSRTCLWKYKHTNVEHHNVPLSRVYAQIIQILEQNNGFMSRSDLQAHLVQRGVIPALYEWWRVRLRMMLMQDRRFVSARKVDSVIMLWFYLPIFETNSQGRDVFETLFHVRDNAGIYYLQSQSTCAMQLSRGAKKYEDIIFNWGDMVNWSYFIIPTNMICLNIIVTDHLILLCKPVVGPIIYDEFFNRLIIVTTKWEFPHHYATIEISKEGEDSYYIMCDVASSFLFRYVRIRNCTKSDIRIKGLYHDVDVSPLQFVRI